MSLNKVMLIGNVGKEPEVRYLEGKIGSPTKMASFSIATSERYKDRNGELRENTEWHNVVVWRALADIVEKYVKKGQQIYIEGKLRTRSWVDNAGQKHYTTEIQADDIQLLGKKSDNSSTKENTDINPNNSVSGYSNINSFNKENSSQDSIDDDLPF